MKTPYVTLRIQDSTDRKVEIVGKQNEFLDCYSLYLKTGCSIVRDEVRLKAYELHMLDPSFSFQI